MKRLNLVSFLLVFALMSRAQAPLYKWTFDNGDLLNDQTGKKKLDIEYYHCKLKFERNLQRSYVETTNSNCLVPINIFQGLTLNEFSFEFDFNGQQFLYTTFPKQTLLIKFEYDYIQFITTITTDGQEVADNWIIRLNGDNVPSFSALADDNWHHIAFKASALDGMKEITVDGKYYSGLQKKIETKGHFIFKSNDGFKSFSKLDELEFYDRYKGSDVSGNRYVTGQQQLREKADKHSQFDSLEYAPGYPEYNVRAIDQLKAFPSPRMPVSSKMLRNFSWTNINYFHRELAGAGGKGFGVVNPSAAANLAEEMVVNWNYYLELVTLRQDSQSVHKIYSDKGSVENALIHLANSRPDFPTSTIVMQAQINPLHAGFESAKPYIFSQQLPDLYYLRDEKAMPIISQGRKWLSPLAPLDIIEKDGLTTGFYLRQLQRYLNKPITYINENGEVFGHMRPENLLNLDPAILQLKKRLGLSNSEFNGYFQYRLDSTYKVNLLRSSGDSQSLFSIYDVSAVNPGFWPAYSERIFTNSLFNERPRSTPSFYPRTPDNWKIGRGPDIGYGVLADGRKTEIKLGVKLFAPFVSAGWSNEESNIRPAQWLALLKSLVMLGADFFHVGYFNVTDSKGQWPNGKGPYDPRGYAYQVAMPVYAQAVAAMVMPFLIDGELLNPVHTEEYRQYRFKGKSENELILVRKLHNRYLIYGSIQPNSNFKYNIPDRKLTSIDLQGETVQFEIRRQGSMYILDNDGPRPVFYQLDGWHQYEHPYFWKKEINIEAELFTDCKSASIQTEKADSGLNFTKFVSYVTVKKNGIVSYLISTRKEGEYNVKLKVRSKSEAGISVSIGAKNYKARTNAIDWSIVEIDAIHVAGSGSDILTIYPENNIDIDSIQLIPVN